MRTGKLLLVSGMASILTGCAVMATAPPQTSTGYAISGHVHGGQQPVSAATIQLYAASTTASMGASTALLTTPVTTDANGQFSITSDYTCPTAGALVYLVASGGNPGLGANLTNANISLMAALGTCGSLSSATFVNINELTTVASIIALAPFMADVSHIGSAPANATGLAGAFAGAESMVDFSTGEPQTSGGLTPSVAAINTLADILATCVNSHGGAAGDGTACGNLFLYAANGTTADTLTAMLHIAQAPGQNVAQIFNLASATAPFQPVLTTAPNSWMMPSSTTLPIPLGYEPVLLVVDTSQHIWIDTQTEAYDTGSLLVYDNNGNLLATIKAGAGGLLAPLQMLADPLGNVWTLNRNFTLSKFDKNGNPISPTAGFPLPISANQPPPVLAFLTAENASLPANHGVGSVGPGLVSFAGFDPSGNLWGLGAGTTSGCLIEVNNAGKVITPSGNFCASASNALAIGVATDRAGNVWVSGSSSVSKASSAGAYIASGINTNGCFSLNPTDLSAGTFDAETLFLTYDRVHDQLWGIGGEGIGALRSDGSQVFCEVGSTKLPVITVTGPDSSESYQGDFIGPYALDGAGTLWFFTNGDEHYGTNSLILYDGLNAIDYTGKLLTPYSSTAGLAGVYGLSSTTTVVPLNGGDFIAATSVAGTTQQNNIAVDAYGNIWTAAYSSPTSILVKIPGLAVPKLQP